MAKGFVAAIVRCRAAALLLAVEFSLIAPAAAADFVQLEGGTFRMGQEGSYREEAAVRTVTVGPFMISRREITNADFAAFVEATGYVTTAESGPDPLLHPDWPKELLVPGSMVFIMPEKIAGSVIYWNELKKRPT